MFSARPSLNGLQTYDVEEAAWPVKMDANEMPEGFTGGLQAEALRAFAEVPLNRYPQIAATSLRQELARNLGLATGQVLVGNGSSELLGAICYAFGGTGRKILFPSPSFSMYGVYAGISDSEGVPVPLREDFTLDPEVMAEEAKALNASLVILCNPNNPTGTTMPQADIEYILSRLDCPVVVDEAYHEFYGETSQPLLAKYPNLMIARTFSKAYGLAAARVGYLMSGPEIAGIVGKIMLPYHLNALSLAVASVVFRGRDAVMTKVRQVVAERERLAGLLKNCGDIQVYPSATNFLLIKTAQAGPLAAAFASQGIGIRDFSKSPLLPGCLRITIGTKEENDKVAEVAGSFFK